MELVNTNNENSFDPTPRLKSSPIPIKFISFNWRDENCVYCGEKYIETLFTSGDNFFGYYKQKYCKKCLSSYINDITDNNIYLDVYIYTMDLECNEHEISRTKVPQCIQECCRNCLRILYFKQINVYFVAKCEINSEFHTQYDKVIESEKDCKLCGKSSYTRIGGDLTLCSDCYLISSGLIESTLTKKQISILYLPWWHNSSNCNACSSKLTFTSDNQKYCTNCLIFYIGCRYCLTTNIIFGLTGQSQCKKCKRISIIINCGYNGLDDFLLDNITYNNLKLTEFVNIIKKIDEYFTISQILGDFFAKKNDIGLIKWIPYSQFTNVEKMTKGGYGIIYKATWLSNNETVILKRFENSKNIGKYFLNELKSFQHCFINDANHIIKTYGFTKDPELEDYILVLKYASEGDLHKYLQKNFTDITWNKQKLRILWQISEGLEHIHKKKFIHRDFHSGNILFDLTGKLGFKKENYQWKVADLGLSQSLNNDTSSNNEIYGVIPYIAPEIFTGSSFSKEADVYSLGMIMWELTTGCKPFDNVKHDHNLVYKILDGERPKITEDTPECYANLMKSCWDHDPKKRPSIKKIRNTFGSWFFRCKNDEIFDQAEAKRKKLIELKMIGPEFAEKRHSEAIYTSRPLSALISKYSSTYSSSTISFGSNYKSKLKNNTVTKSLSSQNLNFAIRNFSTPLNYNYISTDIGLDIDIGSSSSRNLTSTIQNFSTSLKKRRNEIFLNEETHGNDSGKRVKTSSNYT
ncbi:hypothetical protein RclHR1_00330033 [Rhizophagus clarus]|uniref:Kinase-like domain-containing protein n=1 Tax=Rhizophagus clarus TaxID=94130 RepID=A0A2Z6S316_9GLOM|nr:hypothetical protein RclHR1_00330033 [Rhizophagus clarus]GES81721.1 kinase-like domain-containing protein [Rhizophagus clarus]